MSVFGKSKQKEDAFRFCVAPTELPHSELFLSNSFTVALSQISHFFSTDRSIVSGGVGLGVLHENYGNNQPLLPVEVVFSPSPYRGRSGGRVDWLIDDMHYIANLAVFDPDGQIYAEVSSAFEHALNSGDQFLHLRFHRQHRDLGGNDGVESLKLAMEESEAFRQRLRALTAGDTSGLPRIEFEHVSVQNRMTLKAPAWSYLWPEKRRSAKIFNDPAVAQWRKYNSK